MQRTVVWWFAGLLVVAIAAFWPSYFAAPPFKRDFYHVHFHGGLMFAWYAMLFTQALLVRAGFRAEHRAIGKVSYALVPLIVASTILLSHLRAREGAADPVVVYFLYVQLALIVFFALCYAWAIAHRGEPMVHARYMIGTALAGVDPMLARLLYNHFGIEPPALQLITYGVVVLVLGVMLRRERTRPMYAGAWRRMLGAYLLLVVPTFFVTGTDGWRAVVAAYGALPLP